MTRAAVSHDLGNLTLMRRGSHPIGNFLFFLGIAGLLVGGSAGLVWIASLGVDDAAKPAIVASLGAAASVALALIGLSQGFTALYIFERGLIRTRNWRIDVATLNQIDELHQVWGDGRLTSDKILGYRLIFFGGSRWFVEAETSKDKTTTLADRLMAITERQGRRMTRWPRPQAVLVASYEPPGKGIILLNLAIVTAAGAGLAGLGTPGWLAATLAFAAVGYALIAIGTRNGTTIRVLGYTFLGIGGLCAAGVTVPFAAPLNRWITFALTIAVEVVIVRLIAHGYRWLASTMGHTARRLTLKRHGWTVRGHETVPVPSPATAVRLLGLPSTSTTADAIGVAHRTFAGVDVTVFDRIRRRTDPTDRPQTAWFLHLPVRLQHLSPADLSVVEPDSWWIDGDLLIHVAESRSHAPIDADGIESTTRRLLAAVASLDPKRLNGG